ncbi:phosphate regulon sensor protein PhoR (SphS) [Pelagibacterium halotolerans B2]|uniref:histidine kinase n=1 Tax=Pelagibacterium halotolerans (strain DSM 22347 / JCM 15775 / CGMCC 1.7692 / B2) TaxID=1082931 RepID=G4R8R1_PELHB|nr:phosphate regulon sensor protein PhoR (SphS) [Pelagibacterium halotolerans B2]
MKTRPEPGRPIVMASPLLVGGAAVLIVLALAVLGRLAPLDSGVVILAIGAITAIAMRASFNSDAQTEQVASVGSIDGAVERFSDILTEPCLIINERAVLIYRNPAALKRFPRARTGDPLAFTLRDPDLVEAIDRAIATGAAQGTELHIPVPNETWYRASVVPYRPEEDRSFVAITLYDFTEQKRTDRMRGDFIANASHELRTPLTSLMGFIDTLQGPAAKDEAARGRFLGIMRSQSERMSSLIDDLLSLSRIELRQHVKPTTEVNLNLLLREVAETLEPKIEAAELVLDLKLPDEPVTIIGDRQELFEVVENLADNAIKYGGDGGRVEIALVAGASRSGAHHAITVTDFGAGIAEEHVPRLTERFYRGDAEANRKKKGTGLGLAIVKHIVARHHGQLSIRSKLGEGTRVEILLPR